MTERPALSKGEMEVARILWQLGRATVREVHTDDSERLLRWKEFGLVPGARCEMLERRELEDVMRLRVSGREVPTGSSGIAGVQIERD